MAVSGDQSARDIATPLFKNKPGHEQDVTCLTWLTDDRLVTGSKDKTVRIWTLTEGTQVGVSMVHEFQVRRVGITGDGRIISCCVDEQMVVQVWNADTQELESGPWSCGSSENYGIVHRITLSQAPHDKLFATWYEKCVVIWEMAGIMRIRGEFSYESIGGYRDPHATCFSPDGKRLAAFYEGGHALIVLDVASGQVIFEPLKWEPQSQINHMLWSPDGARLLCCVNDGRDGSTCWIDSSTGETIGEPWTDDWHRYVIRFASSPDGKWVASGTGLQTILFWSVESRSPIGEPLDHGSTALEFSPSGEFIACGTRDGGITAWRVPWWDHKDKKSLHPLLDLSPVVHPDRPSNIPHEPDHGFLDISGPRRAVPPEGRLTEISSKVPPRVQVPGHSSLRWWRRIPRLVVKHSDRIYPGFAPARTYVPSTDSVHTSTDPGSPVVEFSSGDDASNPTAEPEVDHVGCCGLLSRRQPRGTAAREQLGQRPPAQPSAPTTHPPNPTDTDTPAVPPSPRPAPQDILELSAVV